jgi:hypothetical protein
MAWTEKNQQKQIPSKEELQAAIVVLYASLTEFTNETKHLTGTMNSQYIPMIKGI